jgi:hypothetical protein
LPHIRELLDFGAVTLDSIILPRIGVTGEALAALVRNAPSGAGRNPGSAFAGPTGTALQETHPVQGV